jgi:hypothetical protein
MKTNLTIKGMGRKPDTETTEEMYKLYQEGLSLSQVGRIFKVSRQSVYDRFARAKKEMRKKKRLSTITFNGVTYSKSSKGGYYRRTDGNRNLMHRDVWEYYNETIPYDHDIHHINEDRTDNRIENLMRLSKSDHTKLHGFKNNQHTIKRK